MTSNFINDVTFSLNVSTGGRRRKLVPGSIITALVNNFHGIPNESINHFISVYEKPSLTYPAAYYTRLHLSGDDKISLMYLGVRTRHLQHTNRNTIQTCFYKVLVIPTTKIFWLPEETIKEIAIINALNEVFTWKLDEAFTWK